MCLTCEAELRPRSQGHRMSLQQQPGSSWPLSGGQPATLRLCHGNGIHFVMQPGLCCVHASRVLAAGTTLPWAVACLESPRKERTLRGWPRVT